MKRAAKIAAVAIAVLIGLPLLGLVGLTIFANTGTGRATIETLTAKLSGGTIRLEGLSGRFPDRLRLAHAEIADKTGVWLTLDNLALDWSPAHLLGGEATIDSLTAGHVAVARLPENKSASSKSNSAALPLRLALNALRIDRLDLGAALAGLPAALRVTGKAEIASLTSGDVALDLERLDGPGSYHLAGKMTADGDNLRLDLAEPARGLLGEIAGLPDLGAVSVAATLAGPRNAEQLGLAMKAGALSGNGKGTIDLIGQSVDLDLTVAAPAMAPRADLHWQSANIDLHVHGPFTGPVASGTLAIADLTAGGASIAKIAVELQGDRGQLDLTGSLDRLRVPGAPDLFAAAPIALRADAILDTPTRPVTFAIAHPLFGVDGQAQLGGELSASATLTLPDLAPFAALGGTAVEGHGAVTVKLARQDETNRIALDGSLAITGGDAVVTKLLGETATLSLAGSSAGADFTLDRAALDGAGLHGSAHGALTGEQLDLAWGATLADISALAPTLSGPLSLEGRLQGPQDDLALSVQGHGRLAATGLPSGAIDASITASGLPAHPSGQIDLRGQLADAPVTLSAKLRRGDDGAVQLALDRAQWKSLAAQGDVTLAAGASFPTGRMQLHAARLADLAPLIGVPVAGSIDATLDTIEVSGAPQAHIHAEARQLAAFGDRADQATLDATIKDPLAHPVAATQIVLAGITAANGITGSAKLEANGPQEALGLRLTADLTTAGGPAHISSAATAQLPQRALQLTALQADYHGETIRLLAPARLRFAEGIAVDQLRIGAGSATLAVAGQIAPRLHLTVSLRNATPALAKPFFPTLDGSGTLALDANFAGTLAAPTGTVRATGRDLRIRNGAGGAVPAADLDASATLDGKVAQIQARLTAGANLRLQVAGAVPLDPASPFDLHSSGNIDLVMLDPLLNASGRSLRGQVALDFRVAGAAASPRVTGSAHLADGSVQDFVQGVHVTAINGAITADGDTLRLTQLSGKAGDGTIAVNGTIALAAPMAVDLTITARNARPLASDLLTATLDTDVTVKGDAAGALTIGGRIHVSRAEIQIPDSFPKSVTVLDVRRPGQKAPPPPAAPIGLDLVIDAPQQVFVRGHGLDAEMGGQLQLGGTSRAPQISGGFDLRHGTFNLAGQTLNFNRGRVAFDGYGLSAKLDPTLDFTAESSTNSVTATLAITGYADQPKIRLSSSPDLPQDEILAQLLFGQSVKQLSPFQVVAIAQALAEITGIGGGASDPLAGVRKGLGLDRLSVGAASGNAPGAAVEAGKYVANGVYVGTKQGTSGGAQAQVQIDLTKHLKLETQLGTGGQPATGSAVTPDNDPGSSIGLSYQFEY